MVDISQNHIRTQGLHSSLSYVARTDLDYGTLLCWGTNSLGEQQEPCIFKVVPAEEPRAPSNCTVLHDEDIAAENWTSSETAIHHHQSRRAMGSVLAIRCLSNNNLELSPKFSALVYDAHSKRLLANVSNSSAPEFFIRGVDRISDLDILIRTSTSRGVSETATVRMRTSVDIAEKRTAQVRHNPSQSPILETQTGNTHETAPSGGTKSNSGFVPVLAVALGTLGCLVALTLVAFIFVLVKKHTRSTQLMTIPCSLAESPDSNPDVVPDFGKFSFPSGLFFLFEI